MPHWVESIPGWFVASVSGIIAFLAMRLVRNMDEDRRLDRESLQKQIDAGRLEITEHIATCNEIPKGQIVEKIDSLCEKQDLYHEENCRRFSSLEGDIRDQRSIISTLFKRQPKGAA